MVRQKTARFAGLFLIRETPAFHRWLKPKQRQSSRTIGVALYGRRRTLVSGLTFEHLKCQMSEYQT
jgi:hypothetical protein